MNIEQIVELAELRVKVAEGKDMDSSEWVKFIALVNKARGY